MITVAAVSRFASTSSSNSRRDRSFDGSPWGEMHVDGVHLAGVDPGPQPAPVVGGRARKVDDRARLVLTEDPKIDVANERLLLARVLRRRSLDRCDPTDESPTLGVPGQVAQQ
jgi:hypothetical protein